MREREEASKEFEDKLRCAMRRVEAPAGLLHAVMAATLDRRAPARVLSSLPRPAWIGSLAASLFMAGLLVGGIEHRRGVERARAERDFKRAVEITDRTLEHTLQQLQQAGVALD